MHSAASGGEGRAARHGEARLRGGEQTWGTKRPRASAARAATLREWTGPMREIELAWRGGMMIADRTAIAHVHVCV